LRAVPPALSSAPGLPLTPRPSTPGFVPSLAPASPRLPTREAAGPAVSTPPVSSKRPAPGWSVVVIVTLFAVVNVIVLVAVAFLLARSRH
jgi:hypothetical protein